MVTHPFRIANRARLADDEAEALGQFDANTPEQAANAEIEQARQVAHEAGWKQGFDAGRKAAYDEAREEIASLVGALQTRLAEAEAEKSRIGDYLSEAVCDLGVQLAEALLDGNANFDRSAIFSDVITEARQEAAGRGVVVCHAHPMTLAQISGLLVGLECQPDETMKEGGIEVTIVSRDTSEILARWDARIERQILALRGLAPKSKRRGQFLRESA